MTFEEQGTELRRLEDVALARGLSVSAFERIVLAVIAEATAAGGWTPAWQLDLIDKRIRCATLERTLENAGSA